jgi:hypothetical protein
MLMSVIQWVAIIVLVLALAPVIAFLLGFLARVVVGLRSMVTRPASKTARRVRALLSLLLCGTGVSAGLLGWLIGISLRTALQKQSLDATTVSITVATSFGLVTLGIYLFRVGRRLRRPVLSVAATLTTTWPVVYLRPFASDIKAQKVARGFPTMIPLSFKSEEEHLVDLLEEQVGQVIAIAHPAERLNPLGAARVQISDEMSWRMVATSLIEQATLIVLRPGVSDGFCWELQTCLKLVPLQKLLFLLPKSKQEYLVFRERVGSMLPLPDYDPHEGLKQPSRGTIGGLLTFDVSGLPCIRLLEERLLSLENPYSSRAALGRAMTPALATFRAHQPTPTSSRVG